VSLAVVVCASDGNNKRINPHTHAARPQPARQLWQPAAGDAAGELLPYGAMHPGHNDCLELPHRPLEPGCLFLFFFFGLQGNCPPSVR